MATSLTNPIRCFLVRLSHKRYETEYENSSIFVGTKKKITTFGRINSQKNGLNLDTMINVNTDQNHIEFMNSYEIHVTNGNSINNLSQKKHPFLLAHF